MSPFEGLYTGWLLLMAITQCACEDVLPVLVPCSPGQPTTEPAAPPLPELPDRFHARIELTEEEALSTMYVEEYFDQPGNRADIYISGLYVLGNETRLIANYDTAELYMVNGKKCITKKVSNNDLIVFAFTSTEGKDFVLASGVSLQFGMRYHERYMGRDTVRGIPVDHWHSCFKNGTTTTNIDYYFAVKKEWSLPGSSISTPVRAVFNTVGGGENKTQRYEYVYFSDTLPDDEELFLTPPMVYCEGRKNTKPFPRIPRHFQFQGETAMTEDPVVYTYRLWYDYDNQLTRYEGAPPRAPGNLYGTNPYYEVKDFKSGIRYTIDQIYGNCTASAINYGVVDTLRNGLAYMKNQSDFFDLNLANYTYVGQRKIRNIDTDVWIGHLDHFPPGTNISTTWEWHFSKPGVYFDTPNTNESLPVQLTVSTPGTGLSYKYSIVDFDGSPLDFSLFDVTPCFEDLEIRRFQFEMLTATGDEVPQFDLFPLMDAIRTVAIIQAGRISVLRVQQIEIDYKQRGVLVSFALLGLPPITGDSPFNGRPPEPLDAVADKLRQSIVAGHFRVILETAGVKVNLTAVGGSLKQLVRTEDGKFVEIDVKKTTSGPTGSTPVPSPTAQCTVSGDASPRRRKRAAPPLPTLPDEFFARIEFSISGENKTLYLEEFFNKSANLAEIRALGLYEAGQESRYIASYNTNEFFTVEYGQCSAAPLLDADTFIFPFKAVNGKDRIMGSQEALQFGNNMNEQYVGVTTVRDIPVDHWRSCISYPESNETVTIDYYFAVNDLWTMASGVTASATPIKSEFHGVTQTDTGPYQYTQFYEYVYFQDYIPPDKEPFLTPPMMYCAGRKNTKEVPKIPTHFSFRAESILESLSLVIAYDLWYDLGSQLTRMDSVPLQLSSAEFGLNPFMEIRDFKSGIRYTIDKVLGNCSLAPLDVGVTDLQNAQGDIVMKDQNQLFNMDMTNFVYVGERKTRDIITDVWIGQKRDFPAGTNLTSTWEWHFSKPGQYFNTGDPTKSHPVRFAVNVQGVPLSYQYNIIDFDDSPIDQSLFDITPCFVDAEIQRFQIDLKTKDGEEVPDFDLFPLKDAVRSTVMAQAAVSVLRVQEIEVDYNQKGVHISFALLGAPTIGGDAPAGNSPPVLPLDVVADKLKQNIESGRFSFTLSVGQRSVPLSAVKGTLKQLIKTEDGKLVLVEDLTTTPSQTAAAGTTGHLQGTPSQGPAAGGFSAGAVAGAGVGCVFLGLLVGVVAMYVLHRKQVLGAPIPMDRFK